MKNQISKIICVILFAAIMVLLCSCSGNAAIEYQREIESLEGTVCELQTTIEILEAKIDVLESLSAGTISYYPGK